MEMNDQSKNGPQPSEKSDQQEKQNRETKFSRLRWWNLLKKGVHLVFMVAKTLWRKLKEVYLNLFRPEGDTSPLEDIKGAFRHIPFRKKGLGYVLPGFILGVYLLSGVYTVEPGEEAVARVFGKEVRKTITEGLHYRLPWPFEEIEKVNIMEIRRVDVGMSVSEGSLLFPTRKDTSTPPDDGGHGGHGGHAVSANSPVVSSSQPKQAKIQFLTGDENILEIKMNIQYRIKDTSDYLFNVDSPDSLVPYASRMAVTELFGGMQVDELLTVAKAQIQRRMGHRIQKMLDEYGTGLYIVNVNLQEVNPPQEVAQAFRDVASAKEEREETINKAQGYWNAVIPEARGKAHNVVSKAEGYREEVINRAKGDAEKFSAMLAEYRKARNVTEYRLYLETIEKILTKTKKFVIDSKKERVNLKFVK